MSDARGHSAWVNTALSLGLIMGLALAVDTFFFAGFLATSDDNCNLLAAHRIVNGQPYWQPDDPRPYLASAFRLSLTLPSALLYYLGRGRVFWVTYGHIAYHLALIPLAYLLGKMLHQRRTGLLAALLAALQPLFYAYAGACLPDNVLSLWLGLATLALLYVQRQGDQAAPSPRVRWLLLAGAGFCLGLGYACKETGLLMLAPAALILARTGPGLLSRQVLGNALAFALGLLFFLGLEQIILHALTGRWVLRWSIIAQAEGHFLERATVDGLLPTARAARAWEEMNRFAPITLWLTLAAALAYPWLKEANRLLWAIPVWFLLYITFGSTSPWRYVPAAIMDRYYAVAMLPAMVMLAQVALAAGERLRPLLTPTWGKRAAWALAALPLALVLYEARGNLEQAGEIYRVRQARSFVEALDAARTLRPGQPVVLSNALSDRMLALFLQDQDKVVLRNVFYHHFRDKVPDPPFVYLGDYQALGPPSPRMDLPPRPDGREYQARLERVIMPGFSRYDTLLQGNALAGLNPVLAGRRIRLGDTLNTYLVVVDADPK